MKIVVCVKLTPDTETRIKLGAGGSTLDEIDFKYIINPYDEYAIEEAVKTAESRPGSESVVVGVGPAKNMEGLRRALAMGIDRGVWVSTDGRAEAPDSFAVASALHSVVAAESPDVVFCGHKAIDDDCGHVGPMLAELLGAEHVQVVSRIDWQGATSARVDREIEGGMTEVYEVPLPAVFGCQKTLNQPRFTALPGIVKAKKKPLVERKWAEVTSQENLVRVVSYALPAEKPKGKVLSGEPVEVMVEKLVGLLRNEAKVI